MEARNPDTALTWIIEQLVNCAELVALLPLDTGDNVAIYQDEHVGDGWPRVIICPPTNPKPVLHAEKWQQTVDPTFTVFAEMRDDKLADGQTLDSVLTPLHMALQQALSGVSNPDAPTGGTVHSCRITSWHLPKAIKQGADIKTQQKGMRVCLLVT